MLRTLLAPRLVALHLLVIGVLVSFTFLGRWQLGVFEASGGPRRAPDPAPVAVTELTQVGQHIGGAAISRRVTATGTYDAANQLLVADRVADVAAPGGRAARGADSGCSRHCGSRTARSSPSYAAGSPRRPIPPRPCPRALSP
ncbi:hypothetical protein GCM10027612_26300 [Microbispora bryophytorum subsp. camponoti]